MKRALMTTAAICAVLTIGATAYGVDVDNDYRTTGSGTWSTSGNWQRYEADSSTWVSITYYPGHASEPTPETVHLQHQMNVNVSNAAATVLDVNQALTINDGCTMIVYSDVDADANITINGVTSGMGTLDIRGSGDTSDIAQSCYIQLNGTDSTHYGRVLITQDHTIGGSGTINGNSQYGAVEIASSMTLESQVAIQGTLRIVGAQGATETTLLNNGSVNANGGIIEVYTTYLDNQDDDRDTEESGDWIVGTSGNELWIRVGSDELSGDITVGGGTLDVDATMITSGEMSVSTGTIEVYQGTRLQALSTN